VAAELGVTTNAVLYRVRQFQQWGLLEVSRVERRAGRSINYYRSTSRGYFVPFLSTTAESVPELYRATLQGVHEGVTAALTRAWRDLAQDERWFGLYTYGDESGLHAHVVLPNPPRDPSGSTEGFITWLLSDEAPAVWDNTFPLRLTRADAKELQREIRAREKKYQARRLTGGAR